MTTFTIAKGSGEKLIKTYSNKDAICFEEYNYFLNDNFPDDYLTFSKDGNNFVVERYIAGINDSSVVLKDYFVRKTKTVLNTINNQSIIGNVMIDIDGSGKIYGTFLDDIITGSNGNDIIYSSDGADDVYAKAGDDIIYTSTQGSNVEAGTGNDIIYVKKSSEDYENGFIFNAGDGSDTIYNSSCYDYIMFNDINPDKVSYNRAGNDLIVQSGGNEKDFIRLKNWFSQSKKSRINYISFSYADRIQDVELKDVIIQSFSKNETLYGDAEKGYIFHTGSKGSKLIFSGSDTDIINVNDFSNTQVIISDNSELQSDEFNREFTDEVDENYDPIPNEKYKYTLNDELHLNNSKKGEGAFIFFDVATDDNNPPFEYSPNLFITKNSNILSFMTPKYTPGFVSIENWFANRQTMESNGFSDGNGKIEHVYYNNAKINVDDYVTRVTVDVRAELKRINSERGTNFKSAMEVLQSSSKKFKNEKQAIINCYTKENAHIKLFDVDKKTTFYGSNGNDVVLVKDNFVVNSGKGNDKLYRFEYKDSEQNFVYAENYTLNGEDGNDVLEAGMHTTINGGKGENAIIVNANSDVTITHGKGKDYIQLSGDRILDFKYTKNGNTLIMEARDGAKITLKDYFKYGTKSSIKGISETKIFDKEDFANKIISDVKNTSYGKTLNSILSGASVVIDNVPVYSKNAINGTSYNDNINTSGLYLDKTIGKGKKKRKIERAITDKGLTINGGNGNDTIDGTKYSDIIKGGNGNDKLYGKTGNDVIYAGNGIDNYIEGNAGNDKIYCEKGNSKINFYDGDGKDIIYTGKGKDSLVFKNSTLNSLTYGVYKNDLVINYGYGDTVRIANYFKAKGKTSVKTINNSDLNQQVINKGIIINGQENKKNKITGTYLNDTITGKNYNDTINGGNGMDKIYGNEGHDYINGGNDIDYLYGGVGNDTIKGGSGNDYIYSGVGNDKLYGESGNNEFCFYNGDGKDTIYMGKGVDSICLENTQNTYPTYFRSGNNLVINYGNKDSITVANYFKSKYKSVKTVNYNSKTDILENDIIIKGYKNADTVIEYNGNSKNNLIYTSGSYNNINAGAGNDTIYINAKKNTFATAGAGNDTVYVNSKADVYGEEGNDIFYINAKSANVNGGTGNDYYRVKSLKSIVTISDAGGSVDKLYINEKSSNINVLFDVSGDLTSLLVVNDANYNKLKKSWNFYKVSSGIEIKDDNSCIEYIYSNNNKMINVTNLRNEVASWLSSKGYDSALDVAYSGNKNDINALLQVYQKAWEPAV